MVVIQASSPPKGDGHPGACLLKSDKPNPLKAPHVAIVKAEVLPDDNQEGDRNLRWPFLMYDMPTILVEDDDPHKSPRISICSKRSSSNSHHRFFRRGHSSTSKSETSNNSKSESNSHANHETSTGMSESAFVGFTSSTNLTVTDLSAGKSTSHKDDLHQSKTLSAPSLVA
eukprot:maker-scaffold133_size323035-snap-gene-2.30 protein:Tk02247 transcript:maker-scaffold133_size323035-snap-gene-2.30-mRNA-1 annotation:"---NA---"